MKHLLPVDVCDDSGYLEEVPHKDEGEFDHLIVKIKPTSRNNKKTILRRCWSLLFDDYEESHHVEHENDEINQKSFVPPHAFLTE